MFYLSFGWLLLLLFLLAKNVSVCVCASIFSAAAVFCLLFWWMCQAHTHTLTSRLFWPILNHGAGCNTISTCHSLAVLSFSQRVVYVDIYFLYSLHVHFSTDGAFLDLLFPFRINYSSIGKIDTRKKQRKKKWVVPSIHMEAIAQKLVVDR